MLCVIKLGSCSRAGGAGGARLSTPGVSGLLLIEDFDKSQSATCHICRIEEVNVLMVEVVPDTLCALESDWSALC